MKTIKVSEQNHKALDSLGKRGQSYNDIITTLIGEFLQNRIDNSNTPKKAKHK